MEIEDFLVDVLFLNLSKRTETQTEHKVGHTNRDETAEDFNDCLPLLLFAVCGSLTAILLIFLRRIEQASDKDEECNPHTKSTRDVHNIMAAGAFGEPTANTGPQALVSPPPPPPSLLSTVLRTGEASSVEKTHACSAKKRDSTITFRHYADLGKEEVSMPKFWCHYGQPGQFALDSKAQLYDSGRQNQKQPSRPQKLFSAQQEQRIFQELDQQQGDGHVTDVEQQSQNEKPVKVSPVGFFLEVKEDQDACEPCHISNIQQCSGRSQVCISSTEKGRKRQQMNNNIGTIFHSRQAKPRRSRQLLENQHIDRHKNLGNLLIGKADLSNVRHVDNVTIDNFTEVMCLDTAKAALTEKSYSHRASDSESRSANHSNSLFKAKQISRQGHMGAKQNYLIQFPPQKQAPGMSISQNKAAAYIGSNVIKLEDRKVFANASPSPQISEMNKLADALSRPPLISKKKNGYIKDLQSRKNGLRLGQTASCLLRNSERYPRRNLLVSSSYQQNEPKSRKCPFQVISDMNYFKSEVANSLHPTERDRDLSCGQNSKRFMCTTLKPTITTSNISTDVNFEKYPAANLYPHAPSISRRLVVTDQVYHEPSYSKSPSLALQRSGTSRRGRRQLGYQEGTELKMHENKKLLSLNNSRTAENSNCLENSRHRVGEWAGVSDGNQIIGRKEPLRKFGGCRANKLFGFGKNNSVRQCCNANDKTKFKYQCRQFAEENVFLPSMFNGLDHPSVVPNCFAHLIPQGLDLLKNMSKSLTEINKYYKNGVFSQTKSSGGGVVRVCHHVRFCPYTDYRQCTLPRRFWKVDSHRADRQKRSPRYESKELYKWSLGSQGLTTNWTFPKEFEKPSFLTRRPESAEHYSIKDYSYSSKIPYTPGPVSRLGNFNNVCKLPKTPSISPEFEYNKPGHTGRSDRRFWTHQPEHGKVFLVESPKFITDKKPSVKIKNKSILQLQKTQYKNRQSQMFFRNIETATTPASCAAPCCAENESACPLVGSRADSDTSKSRLLPMRPEIKSTDISHVNAKMGILSRDLFTCEEESLGPELYSLEDNQLNVSISKVGQNTNSIGRTVFSDTESDGLFQVSDTAETNIRDTSVRTQTSWSELSLSHDLSVETSGQSALRPRQNQIQEDLRNQDTFAKAPKSPHSLNFTFNKSPQISREVESQTSPSSVSNISNNTYTASVWSSKEHTYKQIGGAFTGLKITSFGCARSTLKRGRSDKSAKETTKARKLSSKKNTSLMCEVNFHPDDDNDTYTHSTPSPGYVTRIVDAHRGKLYTHKIIKSYSKLESPPKSRISESITERDGPVHNTSESVQRFLVPDLNLGYSSSRSNSRKTRFIDGNSTIIRSMSCSKGSLSLFGELTAATGSNYSSPSPQFTENKNIEPQGNESKGYRILEKVTAENGGLNKVSDLAETRFKPQFISPKSTKWPQASIVSHGSVSISKPPSGNSRNPSVSPSGEVFPSGARNLSPPRVNSSVPTWSSLSRVTLNMQNSMRSERLPAYISTPGVILSKSSASKVLENGKSNQVGGGHKSTFRSDTTMESAQKEVGHLSLSSLAKQVPCKTLFSSETPSSRGITNSPLCTRPQAKQNREFVPFSANTKFSSSSFASDRNTGKSQMSSARSKRTQMKNSSRIGSIFSKPSSIQELDSKQNLPTIMKNDSTSPLNQGLKEIKHMNRDENPYPVSLSNRKTYEKAVLGAASKETSFIINHTRSQNGFTFRKNTPGFNKQTETNLQNVTITKSTSAKHIDETLINYITAGNERVHSKSGTRPNIAGRDNRIANKRSDLGNHGKIRHKELYSNEKAQERSTSQGVKTEVSHNITGYHTSLRINRRQVLGENTVRNTNSIKPSGKHIETVRQNRALSEARSIKNGTHCSVPKSSQRLENSNTPGPTLKGENSKQFQESTSKHLQTPYQLKSQTSQKSVLSPAALFQISSSDSHRRCSEHDRALFPSRFFTYNKSPSSPLLSSDHAKSTPAGKSDLTRSETFVSERLFAACNSNSDETTRKCAAKHEMASREEKARSSFLVRANEHSKRKFKSFIEDSGNGRGCKTSPLTERKLNSVLSVRDNILSTKPIVQNEQYASRHSKAKQEDRAKRLEKRGTVPLVQNKHAAACIEHESANRVSAGVSTLPKNVLTVKNQFSEQNNFKTRQFRAASRRIQSRNRALGTNNSAAVFPREYWGRMQCSEKMLVLRVPLNLLGLSTRTSNQSPILMQGLRGEGDGCDANDRIAGPDVDTDNEGREFSQLMNHRITQSGGNSSFDWYRPAARTNQQMAPLQRYFGQISENCVHRDLDTVNSFSSISVQEVLTASSSSSLAMEDLNVSVSNQDLNLTNSIYSVSESQIFGRHETSSVAIEQRYGEATDNAANSTYPFTYILPTIKSLSCPNVCEVNSDHTHLQR